MIPFLFLALAAPATAGPPPPASAEQKRFQACADLAKTDPAKAAAEAETWRGGGGNLLARECLGVAYAAQERWGPAEVAFEQAAQEAELQRDGRAANLWVQAGNAALAGDDPSKARQAFDRALALPVMPDQMRGEVYLDRARAGVDVNDYGSARKDLDQALKLVPADPLAWLLSATLARRQKDADRAAKDIAEALRLAPDDASVIMESGNVAEMRGDHEAARTAWAKAAEKDPEGAAGKAAAAQLVPRLDKQGEKAPKRNE